MLYCVVAAAISGNLCFDDRKFGMQKFLQNAPIRVLVILLGFAIAATFALVQLSGIARSAGLWLFAALALLETVLIFGPKSSMTMGGQAKFIRLFVILLAIGAGLYAYVSTVMVPRAVEESHRVEAQQSDPK